MRVLLAQLGMVAVSLKVLICSIVVPCLDLGHFGMLL